MQSKYILVTVSVFIFFMMGCQGGVNNSSQIEQTADIPSLAKNMEIKTKIKNSTIEVYWKFNKSVKSYILEFGDIENTLNQHVKLDKQTTKYKLSNLQENSIYRFKLISIFRDNTQSESKVIEVRTAPTNKFLQIDNGSKF